jgi:hypothetical protein
MPAELTPRVLTSLDVARGNADRILYTLAFLGLTDESGKKTAQAERLRRTRDTEYVRLLAELVHHSYAQIFAAVDPATEGDLALLDAFRPFEPVGQRDRMITLFLALCREAQIVPGGPIQSKSRLRRSPEPRADGPEPDSPPRPYAGATLAGDGALISSLLEQLPPDRRWKADRRERWITALTAAVDLVIEVVPD